MLYKKSVHGVILILLSFSEYFFENLLFWVKKNTISE